MLQWKIGDVTVTSVLELEAPLPAAGLLVGASDEVIAAFEWLRPWAVDETGNVLLRVQALVVDTGDRRIVVDTCIGKDKQRAIPIFSNMQGPFLSEMEAAGYPRETIDTVICTHLHVDHVGWNTMLVEEDEGEADRRGGGAESRPGKRRRWVPTFPNARYLMVRSEVEYWEANPTEGEDIFGDSVRPVIEAGLADLVEPGHVVADGITMIPTPGHTPGHVSVEIESGDVHAVISGDVMHHPSQCGRPDWAAIFDADPPAAEKARREFLERYADREVLVIGTHFPAPTAGRIERSREAYAFRV